MEEALDLSFDRLLMMMSIQVVPCNIYFIYIYIYIYIYRNEYQKYFLGIKAVDA